MMDETAITKKEEDERQTVTRSDLADALAAETVSFSEAYQFVSDFFATLGDEIHRSGKVKIQGIGTFRCIEKMPRIGRNPRTKKEALISRRRVISFVSSRKFKQQVNEQ